MIQGPQFTLILKPQLCQQIIQSIFTYFFPESVSEYSKEDIEFFLLFINEQNKLRDLIQPIHSDDQSQNLFTLSIFKLQLDRVLCKGWGKSEAKSSPLNFYKLEVSYNIN